MNRPVFRKPKPVMTGGTIGIVAPAGSFERETFDLGIGVLHRLGYTTRLADGLFERQGYLAGSDQQRLAQLNAMFADPGIDAIMCARGGFGAMKILSRLDYVSIARSPKVFIGFSDITALHHALYQRLGLVTFHGPMVTSLADADDATLESWSAVLTGEPPKSLLALDKRTIIPGNAQGVVLGGNLATLCHLVGTAFSPDLKDAILIIEEINEPLYRVDRMLTQMKMAGCFQGLAGVVIGDFSGCGSTTDIGHLLAECFRDEAVPVAAGFAFGHAQPNLTIPLGVMARLDADHGELRFLEPAVDDDQ